MIKFSAGQALADFWFDIRPDTWCWIRPDTVCWITLDTGCWILPEIQSISIALYYNAYMVGNMLALAYILPDTGCWILPDIRSISFALYYNAYMVGNMLALVDIRLDIGRWILPDIRSIYCFVLVYYNAYMVGNMLALANIWPDTGRWIMSDIHCIGLTNINNFLKFIHKICWPGNLFRYPAGYRVSNNAGYPVLPCFFVLVCYNAYGWPIWMMYTQIHL